MRLKYLEFYLNLKDVSNHITGIDQFKLNRSSLDSIDVVVPDMKEQLKFEDIVESVSGSLQKKRESNLELATLFNSLSQKAFAGEL